MPNFQAFSKMSVLGVLSLSSAILAHASTVQATDVIFAAGTQSAVASGAGGTVPGGITAVGGDIFTFSVTGTITLNSGGNFNDADGAGAAVTSSSETGSGSISGITLPNAGELVGVFVAAGGPSGAAPASLNFIGGTSFTSLSPLLDQVFFIGDGRTGDGTGSIQTFVAPTGSGELFLGISDACGYNGGPSCYGDNSGAFTVSDTVTPPSASPTPEPSSFMLLGTGALGLFGAARRRCASATSAPLA